MLLDITNINLIERRLVIFKKEIRRSYFSSHFDKNRIKRFRELKRLGFTDEGKVFNVY